MKRTSQKPEYLSAILEGLLKHSGINTRVQEQRVLDLWPKVVGKAIADKTQPLRLKNGLLLVAVGSSVWMQQLHFLKGMIIQKLKEKLGDRGSCLQDLRFCIGEILAKEEEKEEARDIPPARSLSAGDQERIAREVAGVADPEMREILAQIFARGLLAGKDRET